MNLNEGGDFNPNVLEIEEQSGLVKTIDFIDGVTLSKEDEGRAILDMLYLRDIVTRSKLS